MVIDYKVVCLPDVSTFELSIKRYLKEGWETVGGLCIDKEGYYCQSMIKNVSEESSQPVRIYAAL